MASRTLIAGFALCFPLACAGKADCADTAAAAAKIANVHVEISEELLNAVLGSHTRTHGPFRESIQGSVYRGTSTTDAQFSIRTEPAEDGIAAVFIWQGTVRSNSRSSSDRTDVSSVSTTHIGAIKRVSFDDKGLHVQPARAKAKSRSQITSVRSRRMIGRRIARRRAYERQPSVDYSAARRAEQRTRAEFDRQVNSLLTSWTPVTEQGPQFVAGHSTDSRIELALLQTSPEPADTLAETSRPLQSSEGDLSLNVHQSAVNNLAYEMLSGREVREDQLARQLEKRFGWKLEGLEPKDWTKLWSIDFATDGPLKVEFQEGAATVTLTASRFSVGDQQIPGARLRAAYTFVIIDGQLHGERQGRIEIAPLGPETEAGDVGVRFQVFRTMLRRRFERVFPAEFVLSEFPAPAGRPEQAALQFASATTAAEWLHIACELPQPSGKVARRGE